jgi:peptide/nickel transport system permease protein
MVVLLLVLSAVTFLLFSAVPTDPASLTCGKSCSPSIIAANRVRLGLDQPLWIQYWRFLSGIFGGRTYGAGAATIHCPAPCLGYSFRNEATVTHLIATATPVTAQLAIGAFVLWMAIGVGTGVLAALYAGRWPDRLLTSLALVGYSMPVFFIGLLMLVFIVIRWHLLPYPHYTSLFQDPLAWFQTLLLPWLSLAIVYAAFYTRLVRSEVMTSLTADFTRTARAKGLAESVVVRKHALRAGLTPIITAAGLDLAGVLGGAVITEAVFNLPGLGKLAVSSVVDYDLPVITGVTLIAAAFIIIANVVVDVLYAWIDPRVRLTAI